MPMYIFEDVNTKDKYEILLKFSEIEEFQKENPHLRQTLSTPGIVDSVRIGVTKNPDSFKDLLRKMKKENHGSTINI